MNIKPSLSWILNFIFIGILVFLIIDKINRNSITKNTKMKPGHSREKSDPLVKKGNIYKLPLPRYDSQVSLEETLLNRRSHRDYTGEALSAEQLSQFLWAAYGITHPLKEPAYRRGGKKTAPSAGALYPLEIYAVVGKVKGMDPGVYRYIPAQHSLKREIDGDVRSSLSKAALHQEMIEDAPACLFYSAVYERTTSKYGKRGESRYVCMDLGHSAQNVYLQAETLGLGTCAIGAFDDIEVARVLKLPAEETPLYIMPLGRYCKE